MEELVTAVIAEFFLMLSFKLKHSEKMLDTTENDAPFSITHQL